MAMRVMHVGLVEMPVPQALLAIDVCMGFTGRIVGRMSVLVVLAMHVRVGMHHWVMLMVMLTRFCEMQPQISDCHAR